MAERFLNLPSVYFIFFYFFLVLSVTIPEPPRMMSSSANYRPLISSFRRIPPQENFVKLKKWPPWRSVYLVKLGLKSLGNGPQDICKDKESNLGSVAGY